MATWEFEKGDAALLVKFTDYMMPTKLFYRKPTNEQRIWVFWSHEPIDSEHTSTNQGIQDRIKIGLSKLCLIDGGLLVQFWAPEMIGGRRHLTTTLQPFALTTLRNGKLNEYRKHCVGYKFLVENDGDLSMDGTVGRVFRTKVPECCGDLDYTKYYFGSAFGSALLVRDEEYACIKFTITLPLFEAEPGSGGVLGCVGVLELVFTVNKYDVELYIRWVNELLKEVGLRTIDLKEIKSQINDLYNGPIKNEIKAALKHVCNTYDLRCAITWVSFKDSRFQDELLVPSPEMSIFPSSGIFPPSEEMEAYFYFHSALLTLLGLAEKASSLAEKAFLNNNPYLCRDVSKLNRDVSKLSMSDHRLAEMAVKLRSASCFVVCLRNISTGKHEFVIKFLQRNTYSGDLITLFSSILATMKQQLKTFEVVTDLQNEIFIEVDELGESFVKPMTSEGERTPTEYSFQSFGTNEVTLNSAFKSTCRKSDWPSSSRRNRVNESDQAIPESSFSVNECVQRADLDNGYESEQSSFGNSETGSTNWVKLFGYMISANGPHIPILNQRRTESSHSDGPLSEASAVVAHNVPPCTPESDVEWMTIKVSYVEKDTIIKFDLPTSSSKEDLVKEVIMRMGDKLKDKAYEIKYLDDVSHKPSVLIAMDKDWKECMVRTRSRGNKLIKMVIELEKDV